MLGRNKMGPEGRTLKPSQRVGFGTLPDQLVNKHIERGFRFNLLCVGSTGIGKSSLLESLFKAEFEHQHHAHNASSVSLDVNTYKLRDGGVELSLTLASTVGFGDQLDRQDSMDNVIKYIDQQYDRFLQEELKVTRSLADHADTRIHACLYMLPPTGRIVHQLDLMCISQLSRKVNVIPVIAKSDTMTPKEIVRFKTSVRQGLKDLGVDVYVPTYASEVVAAAMPFAVTASRDVVEMAGERVRARVYPWGLVEVENEKHSDFVKLRDLLLRTEMEPLMRTTHHKFYEQYRQRRLESMGFADTDAAGNPVSWHDAYEAKRKEHMTELARKEDEMRQAFVQKVKKKESELKAAELELTVKFEKLRNIHLSEQQAIKQQHEALQRERAEWEKAQQELAEKDGKKKDKKKDKEKDEKKKKDSKDF